MTIGLVARASIKGTAVAARDAGDASFSVAESIATEIANGTGLGQANAVYVDDFSIAASASADVDLSGALLDPNNETIVFTAIKAIFIKGASTNTNNIIVGNGTNPFVGPFGAAAHTLAVKPGGFVMISEGFSAAGWPVTAATADILKLANSGAGTAVAGTIVIIGEV